MINEDKLTPTSLLAAVHEASQQHVDIIERIKALRIESATSKIVDIIKEQACLIPKPSMHL